MANAWEKVKQNIRRERLLFLSNIFVMTVTFTLLGIFVSIIVVSQTALKSLERQAQVTVFFKDDFTEESINQVKTKFETDKRVDSVKYISKDDAFKIFSDLNQDQPILLDSITPQILPASLEIKARDLKFLPQLSDEAAKIDGVEEVKFFKDVIDRFRFWSNIIYAVGFVLVALFLIISYSVILVTIRTVITSKGKELEIMKLVGASDNYVKKPLIYQGLVLGVISGMTSGAFFILLSLLIRLTGFFTGSLGFGFGQINISVILYAVILALILIFSGILLGYLGSYSAIKRYLRY